MEHDKTDRYYFEKRRPEYVYVSKAFENPGEYSLEKRIVHKVFEKGEDQWIERVDVEGEYVVRCSPTGRDQVRIVLLQDSNRVKSFVLQKFIHGKPQPVHFSFRKDEFSGLLSFLSDVEYLDLSNKQRFRVHEDGIRAEGVVVQEKEKELLEALGEIRGSKREKFLAALRKADLSKNDLNILSGRKNGLETFRENLFERSGWSEADWQEFFRKNTWIFGYGLDYRFMKILQNESRVSDVDLDGKETVISDYLLGTNKFTVLVELKKPETKLFEGRPNRSKSWKLSRQLTDAVSQILAQKAEWVTKSERQQYDQHGKIIEQGTADPKTILIIGNSDQYEGNDRKAVTKAKTFELYRRNSRNIEILTYTELYERAYYIVNQGPPDAVQTIDDYPTYEGGPAVFD